MSALRKINQFLHRATTYGAMFVLTLLTITVSYQVLSRYVGFVPRIMWTEELARAGLVWLVFLGAAFAFYERQHFIIDLLPSKLGASVVGNVDRLAQVVMVATLIILTLGASAFFLAGFGRTSTMSGVSLAWSYLAMPISFGVMLLRSVEDFIDAVRHPEKNTMPPTLAPDVDTVPDSIESVR
jgi:TRAP-type transport system small permease protein